MLQKVQNSRWLSSRARMFMSRSSTRRGYFKSYWESSPLPPAHSRQGDTWNVQMVRALSPANPGNGIKKEQAPQVLRLWKQLSLTPNSIRSSLAPFCSLEDLLKLSWSYLEAFFMLSWSSLEALLILFKRSLVQCSPVAVWFSTDRSA